MFGLSGHPVMQSPQMQKAIDLFFEELKSVGKSASVEAWYASYTQSILHPRNRFKDILTLLNCNISDMEVLVAVTLLFEISQEIIDTRSLQAINPSYEVSMETISIFTLYNSIFPIMENNLSDGSLKEKIIDLYNDVTFRLNAPREEEGTDILEARRRFYFDFYLPLQVFYLDKEKNLGIDEEETNFIRMYLIKSKSDEIKALTLPMDEVDVQNSFDTLYKKISEKNEDIEMALNFLFNETF